ncbi:oligosaccharide flippase family protein [archaeon]|nr:oligosaccharide flippase family protein [archaeon]
MLKKVKGLITDAATYGIGNIISKLIGFLLLPIYTKELSVTDYGVIALLGIISSIFTPLANLGISNAIFRRYNLVNDNDEKQKILSTGFLSVLLSSIIMSIIALTLSEPITEFFINDITYRKLVKLTIFSAFFLTLGQIPNVILRAERRVKAVALCNVIGVFVSIGITIWYVVVKQWGLYGFVIAGLISNIFSLLLRLVIIIKGFRIYFSFQQWKALINYGLPFVPHHLFAVGITQFGLFIINEMLGLTEVGLYNIATKITMVVVLVVMAIQKAWVPYKFQIHAETEQPSDFFRSVTSYYIAITSYLWVGVSIWGPEVLRIMTSENFHEATNLIPFVCMIPISQGYYFMFGTGIELTDDTKPMPLISLSGLISIVGMAYLLVPVLGAEGAALATITGNITMSIVAYNLAKKRFAIDYDWKTIILILISAIICVTAGILAQILSFPFRLTIFIIISLCFPLIFMFIFLRSDFEKDRVIILINQLKQILITGKNLILVKKAN